MTNKGEGWVTAVFDVSFSPNYDTTNFDKFKTIEVKKKKKRKTLREK